MKLLRIIHCSDLHFLTGSHPGAAVKSRVTGALSKVRGFTQGLAGHDPRAPRWLRASIHQYAKTAADEWKDKTELVFTGDLTTWADDASLTGAKKFLDTLQADLALSRSMGAYGNHDVWPGVVAGHLPWQETTGNLETRRTKMRDAYFPRKTWLAERVRHPIPGGFVLGVCALNTVLHCRVRNTFAYGQIGHDFYWDATRKVAKHQLVELEEWLADVHVGVILSHHPFHDPDKSPGKRLLGANRAKNALRSGPSGECIRLVLSGHTHQIFPDDLNRSVPLDKKMLSTRQLTTGTCAQAAVPNAVVVQTWQAIELSLDSSPGHLRVARKVFVRNGLGAFVGQPEESVILKFD